MVIDSCSITNVLSSNLLADVALRNLKFAVTSFVRYECLVRPRKRPNPTDAKLMGVFSSIVEKNTNIKIVNLSIEDLAEIARARAVRQIGTGELSCLVLASKIRQGALTDDRSARRLAAHIYPDLPVRTTSHLVGWLVFTFRLTDRDVELIIGQNLEVRGDDAIGPYMRACYEHALMLRLKNPN
jgi:hypothetical protein